VHQTRLIYLRTSPKCIWYCDVHYDLIDINGNALRWSGVCDKTPSGGGPLSSPDLQINTNYQIFGELSASSTHMWLIDQTNGRVQFCDFSSRDKCWDLPGVWQKNQHEGRFSGVIAPALVYGRQLVT
jgi:hypothetical protein